MKTLLPIVFIFLFWQTSNAQISGQQEVIGAAGEELKSNQGTINFTVGEVVTETFSDTNSNIILTQGYQQGYYVITTVTKNPDWEFDFSFWPNPFFQFVNIDFTDLEEPILLKIQIVDELGKVVKEFETEESTKIDLQFLSAAAYFIRVINPVTGEAMVYKIIKI